MVWIDGPESEANCWVYELTDGDRDVLGNLSIEQVPVLARQWATIEEFNRSGHDYSPFLTELLTELCTLAQHARQAGEHLYCWVCM